MWLLLLILGWITYILLKRSIPSMTQTPVWLFWLVMMAPALSLTIWMLINGEDEPPPIPLGIALLMLCLVMLVFVWLISIGRREPQDPQATSPVENPLADSQNAPENPPKEKIRPITPNEEKNLRDCFPWGVFYLQNLDYRPQAILCRGKLRTTSESAYQTIKRNVEGVFGDRFLVLFQESFQGQPFFALVPNPQAKSSEIADDNSLNRPWLALSLFVITLFTTTWMGAILTGVSPEAVQEDVNLLLQGLPYSLGLLTILGVHEFSHYFTAIRYKIKATLPYFIPMPLFLGTFGAFVQMRSPTPNRKALFDVAIAGPLGGFIVTIPLLLWGLSLSEVVPIASDNTSLLNVEALDPRFSFLFSLFSKLMLGSELVAGKAIHLHPLAIAGYIGLIVTALNLMPVGQLDGGHIVHSIYGQRTAVVIGQLARLLMLVLAFIRSDFFIWAIILFFMPVVDQPALNDVTELDGWRDFLGLLSLAILIMILLPIPGVVAQWLSL